MASRKPLVQNAGQIEQLQAGDTLDAVVAEVEVITQTNDEASPIVIGQPVYNDADDGVKLAKANAAGTINIIGLVRSASIAASTSGSIQTSGVLSATTGQWDAISGTTGGLVFGTRYYVSAASAGEITDVAPSSVGQFVAQVGIAISTTELKIDIQPTILL